MSLHRWLQNLRSALAPNRGQRQQRRRGSLRAETHRPNVEILEDYVAKTGTITFALGETTKTIIIEVKGDNKREATETFYLDLFGLSSNSLITKNRGIGTIVNDD